VTAIEITDLHKRYGEVTAIDGLSLTVDEGEFFGLLGPNGAGKTTTMEILTGQSTPDQGSVSVLGHDPVTEPTTVREAVGILPEKESPPSFLTPREYFEFVGAVRDVPDGQIERRIDTWAERLGFGAQLDTLASDLSRGQQQKIMIAAAFFHEPALVFIDEPLANLDPIVQERVKRFLTTYRDAGNTIIITTHNVDVAAALCSRVGIMSESDLVGDVRPDTLSPDESLLDVFLSYVDETPAESGDSATAVEIND
jgi:ABC-2 type transport system ATP-binding protein